MIKVIFEHIEIWNTSAHQDFNDSKIQVVSLIDEIDDLFERSDNLKDYTWSLIQHLTYKCPERQENRKNIKDFILEILYRSNLGKSLLERYIDFVFMMSKNKKASVRLFSVDLVYEILSSISSDVISTISNSSKLLDVMISRCNDKSPKIRSKSLANIVLVLAESTDKSLAVILLQLQFNKHGCERPFAPLLKLLHKRTTDESASVRKASLQALSALLILSEYNLAWTQDDLDVFSRLAYDDSVSIRKQVILSISNLYQNYMDNEIIQRTWLEIVLSLTSDHEVSVQEKALEFLFDHLLPKTDEEKIIRNMKVLEKISSNHVVSMIDSLKLGVQKEMISDKNIQILASMPSFNISRTHLLWLAAISAANPRLINPPKVVEAWNQVKISGDAEKICLWLRIMSQMASNSYLPSLSTICSDVKFLVLESNYSTDVMATGIQALSVFCKHNDKLCQFISEICKFIDERIKESIISKDRSTSFAKYLFVFGEIMINFRDSSFDQDRVNSLISIVTDENVVFSESEKAMALVSLGKCCVVSEHLAKTCISVFIDILKRNQSSIMRNNIIVILGDLCKTHTSVVDQHVSAISLPLSDENRTIRKHTLLVLIRLLQEDFLKFKIILILRVLSCVIDTDEEIRRIARHCFENLLLAKNPGLVVNFFVEALFFFNDVRDHPTFNQIGGSESNRRFVLNGKENRATRFALFSYFVQNMSEEHKFACTSRICHDILGSVVEGTLKVTRLSEELIYDCLLLLSSKGMRLRISKDVDSDDVDSLHSAKQYVLVQLEKKNVVQNIMPVLLSLRAVLEKSRSFCVGALMSYFGVLLSSFSAEDFGLSGQVLRELQYDLAHRVQLPATPATATATPSKFSTPRLVRDGSLLPRNRYLRSLVSNLQF